MPARKCKKCGETRTVVKDSRQNHGEIKRRIECLNCGERWTTYEVTQADFNALKKAKFEMKKQEIVYGNKR